MCLTQWFILGSGSGISVFYNPLHAAFLFFRLYVSYDFLKALWHLQCPVEGNSLFDSGERKFARFVEF